MSAPRFPSPQRRFGQNFLRNAAIARRIVEAAEIGKDDVVLEIGPGTGALTRFLLERAALVVAVEIDPRAVQWLSAQFGNVSNLHLVQGDVRALDLVQLCLDAAVAHRLTSPRFRVVANLPYYITSALLRQLLALAPFFEVIVLTVQAEVAERIIARPPAMSLLGISVQFYAEPELLFRISPGNFFPSPKVNSAVIRLRPHLRYKELLPEALFFRWVHAGFSQPRKQLLNTLAASLNVPKESVRQLLLELGIAPERRAETLSIEEWIRLAQAGEARFGGAMR